jgi:hypothetical protein
VLRLWRRLMGPKPAPLPDQTAARVVSLTIADHVIVGNGRWLSFRQEGFL